jgi:PAS domain S-box-containing protein
LRNKTKRLEEEINEHQLADEALKQSEKSYRELVENANSIILRMDSKGRITFLNRFGMNFFGYKPEEVLGKNVVGTIVPEDGTHGRELAVMIVDIGDKPNLYVNNENENMTRDGKRVWIAWTNKGIKDEYGNVREILCVGNDITQRKEAEEELIQYREHLEDLVKERTAELESFAYSVSHDLRAPLRAMYGFAEALMDDYADQLDETAHDYTQRIATASKRMDTLIQDLLQYTRLSRTEINFQEVNLDQIIGEVLGELEHEIKEKDAQVILESSLPEVMGHRAILVRICGNLLSNAIKFVPPSTRPSVKIRAEQYNGSVRLWIEDNGIGIPEEHQQKIFNIFERLHGGNSYPGTGIGLAIVKKGVERMGGKVGVISAPDKGSRFYVELKRKAANS